MKKINEVPIFNMEHYKGKFVCSFIDTVEL